MKRKKACAIIAELEKQNNFDVDYLPQGKHYVTPDGNFKFVKTNVFYKISCFLCRTITFLFGPIVCAFLGLRVRGRKNLKALKHRGAICVCNHVSYVDTLFIKQAVGHYRSYHTGAPWNNRSGFGGFLLRRAGFLSLGGNIAAMRNFKTTVGDLLQKGAIINYYPEHALWQHYKKPRPLKSGAFKTAAAFGVPVLPLFVTFEGKFERPVINILPIIEPDGSTRIAAQKMQDECAEIWENVYETTYRQKLCYNTEYKYIVINESACETDFTADNADLRNAHVADVDDAQIATV